MWYNGYKNARGAGSMPVEYVNKTNAISIISMATGFGRRVVVKIMDRLADEGKIHILESPRGNTLEISRDDIDLVIKVLKREVE